MRRKWQQPPELAGQERQIMHTDTPSMAQPVIDSDPSYYLRAGWLIVLLGVGGFLLWALLAPLDRGVPLSGTVTVASNRKAIQHQSGGLVEEILVKEGQAVKAGQVLVRMNDVQARTQAAMARIQYMTLRAVEARLIAERDGQATIDFPVELTSAKDDANVAKLVGLQKQLFSSRQAALKNELAALGENIAGLNMQLRGIEESRDSKKSQLTFLKEQLEGLRDLSKDGYIARNRLLEQERLYAQVNGAISEDIGNIGRIQRQIGELSLRRIQRQQEYQKEVRQQLTDAQTEAEALRNSLQAKDFDLSNVLVTAPVDGTVVGMNVFTRGGVIGPGFRMMDLVPAHDPLIVEGQVPVHLIDKIHSGLKVELIFSAFNQNTTPRIPGIVTHVSADRMTDERTGTPYYKMKAEVAPEGAKKIASLQVRPGMPVELFVKTGERTMMNYLLKPVLDRLKTSLTEE